jgi:hypothetical protein
MSLQGIEGSLFSHFSAKFDCDLLLSHWAISRSGAKQMIYLFWGAQPCQRIEWVGELCHICSQSMSQGLCNVHAPKTILDVHFTKEKWSEIQGHHHSINDMWVCVVQLILTVMWDVRIETGCIDMRNFVSFGFRRRKISHRRRSFASKNTVCLSIKSKNCVLDVATTSLKTNNDPKKDLWGSKNPVTHVN